MTDSRIKITSPEMVLRILQRTCEASLPLMIRGDSDPSVAVKGRCVEILMAQQDPFFRIDSVSDRGMKHLEDSKKLQVEFVLTEAKIVFVSTIVSRESHAIVLRLPKSLVSIERRKNARYICTPEMRAFITLSAWQPSSDDAMTPPFYAHHAGLGGYLDVADLSLGGMCFVTRFPALGQIVKRGHIEEHARVYFPMSSPIDAKVVVRWAKRVKEYAKEAQMNDRFDRFYRFGGEFIEPTEQLKFAIRQYAQKLSQEGAL
jgi:hypothetical protein